MKILMTILFLISINITAFSQSENPEYDSVLAKSLKADDYGMRQYYFVILKTGPTVIDDKAKRDSVFRGHLDNIIRLESEGKLIVAGPFMKNDKSYRGIFILSAASKEEAQALLESDPSIKLKVFETEIIEWYGSAALPEYLKIHKKIEKLKI